MIKPSWIGSPSLQRFCFVTQVSKKFGFKLFGKSSAFRKKAFKAGALNAGSESFERGKCR